MKSSVPRITLSVLKVLALFMEDSCKQYSGYEIIKSTCLSSGATYSILIRLEKAGWLTSQWEDVDPSEVGRPRKRLYRITSQGVIVAIQHLTDLKGMTLA